MRCEWGDCSKKAKLQLSMDTGWKKKFCFAHSYKILKRLIKEVHKWNRGLYIQQAVDDE